MQVFNKFYQRINVLQTETDRRETDVFCVGPRTIFG